MHDHDKLANMKLNMKQGNEGSLSESMFPKCGDNAAIMLTILTLLFCHFASTVFYFPNVYYIIMIKLHMNLANVNYILHFQVYFVTKTVYIS